MDDGGLFRRCVSWAHHEAKPSTMVTGKTREQARADGRALRSDMRMKTGKRKNEGLRIIYENVNPLKHINVEEIARQPSV